MDKYRFRVDRRKRMGFANDLCGHQPRPQGFSLKKMGGERSCVDMALLAIFVAMYYGTVETLSLLSLGSFTNDDGDGSEDVKKAIGLLRKTTTLHVHHAFLYIFTVLARLRRENA